MVISKGDDEMAAKLLFESTECSRCGGSGRMPYSVAGGVCFKCGGAGAILTKRGRAAQDYLNEMNDVEPSDVNVGDKLWFKLWFPGDRIIESPIVVDQIEFDESNGCYKFTGIRTKDGLRYWHIGPARRVVSKELRAEQRKVALEYQATLTQAGTVRKRAA